MAKDAAKQQPSSKKKRVPGRPFKPGQSGNPSGRPKKENCLTDVLKEKALIDKHVLAEKLIDMARNGDMTALKYVFDRIDGSPTTSLEVTGANKGPIEIGYFKDFEDL